tara:strand:+ start:368 stop:805 length:438 start_codon:yes stop_codon:yes gene_type:complete
MDKNNIIKIYTDGACSGNPGPGGWGAIIISSNEEEEISGGEIETTNNRMELLAVINALESLKKPSKVVLTSDSSYVLNGITKWMNNWEKNNWKTSDKKAVKNMDLWKRLKECVRPHEVEWIWVRGHSGHSLNDRADEVARKAIPY